MNKLLPLLLALAAPLPALAAGGFTTNNYSPIVFNGIVVQDGKTKVSLYNPTTNDAKWVQVGKKFGNYTVEFQAANPNVKNSKDTVILTVGNSRQTVALQDAATLSTNTPASAATTFTATNNAAAQIDALNARLAEVRNDPNADPRTVQAYEQALQRAASSSLSTAVFSNEASVPATRATVQTRLNADGTRTTITTNANGTTSVVTNTASISQPVR
jgi:hypothetical protein